MFEKKYYPMCSFFNKKIPHKLIYNGKIIFRGTSQQCYTEKMKSNRNVRKSARILNACK